MKGPVPGGSTTQSERAGISFTLLRRDIIQPTYATEPGSRVGLYEILAPLGAGGMGEVYRARDTALKRDVAIKVLPVDWSRDPDRLRRFELEVQAAALNHQHRFHLPGRRARRGALHRYRASARRELAGPSVPRRHTPARSARHGRGYRGRAGDSA